MSVCSGNRIIVLGESYEINQFLINLSLGTSGLAFKTTIPIPVDILTLKNDFSSPEGVKKHYDDVCNWFSENWSRSRYSSFLAAYYVHIKCAVIDSKIAISIDYDKSGGCYEYSVKNCSSQFPKLLLSYEYGLDETARIDLFSDGENFYSKYINEDIYDCRSDDIKLLRKLKIIQDNV